MSELITLTGQQTLPELEAAKATIQERVALIDADIASIKGQLELGEQHKSRPDDMRTRNGGRTPTPC